MVIKEAMDIADLVQEGRVHKRVFRDPAIFEREMEQIFERTWVYVAHETEVAHPGDYKTTYIGLQPVIVTRGADDGQIYVLYNSCRHRGATVCQQDSGNANYFRCAYHGWTYTNRGSLVSVPYPEAYDGDDEFDIGNLGLVRVPRVASYHGFIFASLSAEGPSLEEHLGNARRYIDYFANQGPAGITVRADVVHKSIYNGNWKYQIENVVDHYHFEFTHQSLIRTRERTGRRMGTAGAGYPPELQWSRDVGNGHSVNFYPEKEDHGLYYGVGAFKIAVFPNLVLIDVQIRHIIPKAVDRTELWVHPVLLNGVPAEVNEERLRKHEDFYGPGGLGASDDWEIFERIQKGAYAKGNEWLLYNRSLRHEQVNERGEIVSPAREKPETPQRAFYKQWKQMMSSG